MRHGHKLAAIGAASMAAYLVLGVAAPGVVGVRPALAQGAAKAKADIAAKHQAAMEAYDGLDFDLAKQLLGEALAVARKAGLSGDKALARVHLDLGVVYFAGFKDEEAAITAFADAVKLDPSIEIDIAYRTDQMAAVLAEIKAQGGGAAAASGPCAGNQLGHTLVESAPSGAAIAIAVEVPEGLGADGAAVYYRKAGEVQFARVGLTRGEGCTYEGAIPAAAATGEALHYYVAALKGGESIASRGSAGSPNIIELAGGGDVENPLGAGGATVDVATTGSTGGGTKRVFVAVSLGSGGGYVTGQTEVAESDVGCCFAPALLHLFPEIGYYFSPRTSVSVALRMGFALGANIEGHATAAPAGLVRLRHALAPSGEGLVLSGAVGGGIIRHTVKVEEAPEGMDTDTTASGPFLVGAGVGYVKALSGPLQLVGELNGLAAFPGGIQELGSCPGAGCVEPHFGMQFDVNLGVLMAF